MLRGIAWAVVGAALCGAGCIDWGAVEAVMCSPGESCEASAGGGGSSSTGTSANGGSGPTSSAGGGGAGGSTAPPGGSGGSGGTPSTGAAGGADPCPGGCDDGNPCTVDTCEAGSCAHPPADTGTPCPGGTCALGSCVLDPVASCVDGQKNQGEAGIDCGGPCPGCADGAPCSADVDCSAGACVLGACGCPAIDHLLIAEVRAGAVSGLAPFIEVYNPTEAPFSSNVTLWVSGLNYWQGALNLAAGARATFSMGNAPLPKTAYVQLAKTAGATLDVVCFCHGSGCQQAPAGTCNGSQAINPSPDDPSASLARKPLGLSCIDTNTSAADFATQAIATPGE